MSAGHRPGPGVHAADGERLKTSARPHRFRTRNGILVDVCKHTVWVTWHDHIQSWVNFEGEDRDELGKRCTAGGKPTDVESLPLGELPA